MNEYLQDVPTSTLQLTGVLGLAAVLCALYALRGGGGPPGAGDGERSSSSSSSRAGGRASSLQQGTQQQVRQQHQAGAAQSPELKMQAGVNAAAAAGLNSVPAKTLGDTTALAAAVRGQLAAARAITVSVPGVLLHESTPAALQDGATVQPRAAEVVRAMVQATNVYLIAHVSDDIGEATTRNALEAADLLGSGPGRLPHHRLLFCGTLEGKVSLVRQLEPDLHVDGHPATVEELKRFMPQLLYVRGRDITVAVTGPNVATVVSLPAAFGAG